ncbi:hypothetical protein Tco_1217093 [Tanacetum coccineum]
MVYVVNGVLANGVDMVLEKDFAGFALQEMEIHPLMLLIQTLSIILQTFSPTLHNLAVFQSISSQEGLKSTKGMNVVHNKWDDMIESRNELLQSLGEMLRQQEQPDLLFTPLSKLKEDECFDPGGDFVLEEIEACLTSDSIPPGIDDDDFDPVSTDFEDDYYVSEGDIIYLESLLIKDTIPNLPPEARLFLSRVSWFVFYGKDFPDYEDSRACGFVHRSLDL